MEAFYHAVALQGGCQRQHDHALVVGHVRAHNRLLFAQPQAFRGKIDRFIKAITANDTLGF